jgi:hypothetical protein
MSKRCLRPTVSWQALSTCGLFTKISLACKNQSFLHRFLRASVGVDVNGDGLRTTLLTGPAVDVRADVINSDAVNVADDAAGLRALRRRFRSEPASIAGMHPRRIA